MNHRHGTRSTLFAKHEWGQLFLCILYYSQLRAYYLVDDILTSERSNYIEHICLYMCLVNRKTQWLLLTTGDWKNFSNQYMVKKSFVLDIPFNFINLSYCIAYLIFSHLPVDIFQYWVVISILTTFISINIDKHFLFI